MRHHSKVRHLLVGSVCVRACCNTSVLTSMLVWLVGVDGHCTTSGCDSSAGLEQLIVEQPVGNFSIAHCTLQHNSLASVSFHTVRMLRKVQQSAWYQNTVNLLNHAGCSATSYNTTSTASACALLTVGNCHKGQQQKSTRQFKHLHRPWV